MQHTNHKTAADFKIHTGLYDRESTQQRAKRSKKDESKQTKV